MSLYEVRIRFEGAVSTVQVQARDGSQAKRLVKIQYGEKVVVLEARRIK